MRNYILNFSQEEKEEMSAGHVGVFCQNLGITAYIYILQKIILNKFSFNNGSILEKKVFVMIIEGGEI